MHQSKSPSFKKMLFTTGLLLLLLLSAYGCADREKSSVPTHPWFGSLREKVVKNVPEAARARRLLSLINQLELDLMAPIEAAETLQEQLYVLNADYEAPREDFIALQKKIRDNAEAAHQKFVAFRREMKANLKPEEWQTIMKDQKSLFEIVAHK